MSRRQPARCLLPSTPSSHRTSHSAESDAAGQYSLFQPETAHNRRLAEAERPSSSPEKHRVRQQRRIPPELGRRNPLNESLSAEIQNPQQRVPGSRERTRQPGVSASSWQSVSKKASQSQPPEQERATNDATSLDGLSFLRLPEVKALTGLSKTSLYTMIRDRNFPAPVRLGPRAVAWVRSEVRQWAVERVHASRSAA